MSERWWIIAPMGHRQYDAEHVPEEMEFMGQMVPVINPGMPPLDDWVCDYCNAEIPLEHMVEGEETPRPVLIPVYGTAALCQKCMLNVLKEIGLPPLMKAWSNKSCGCPPCVAGTKMLLMLQEQLKHLWDPQPDDKES